MEADNMAEKNILKDEILNDEELDNVAGGTYLESASDAQKFKELGIDIGAEEVFGVPVLFHDEFVKLREAFNKYGVTIKDNGGLVNENKYFIGNKEVSRDDAWKHIEEQLKK